MEHTILGLIQKRREIAGKYKIAAKADLDAIDRGPIDYLEFALAALLCAYA